MLDKKKKQSLIKKYATHDGDTGSPQVQIAILSEEIRELTDHLKDHKKDFSSRRGLFRKVNLRRKLLEYLESTEPKNFEELVKKLKIKRKIVTITEEPIEEPKKEVKSEEKTKETTA